tara:strand:- start:1354 stop:1614 length:261 start_codon:yes stop_codon:yes gene_type:complete
MKAIGKCLIIEKTQQGTTETKGGLLLGEINKEDIRYIEASVLSVGDQVNVLKKDDKIYYDKHAGHKIEVNEKIYHIIKEQDVVVVL